MANKGKNKGTGKHNKILAGVTAGVLASSIFASGFGACATGEGLNPKNNELENNETEITQTIEEDSSTQEGNTSSEYAFLSDSEAEKVEKANEYAEMVIEKLNELITKAQQASSYAEASEVMDEWLKLITDANQSAVFNTDGLSQEAAESLNATLSKVNEVNAQLATQVESGSNAIMGEVYSAYTNGVILAQVINNEIADASTIRTTDEARRYLKELSDSQQFLNEKAEFASATVTETEEVASGPNGSYTSSSISIDGTGTSRFDKCLSDSFKKAIGIGSLSELNVEVRDAFLEDLSQSKALAVAVLQESADDLKNAVIDQDAQKVVDSLLATISFQTIINPTNYDTSNYSAEELKNLDAEIADYNNGMYEIFVMFGNIDELVDAVNGIISKQDSIYLIDQEVNTEDILKFINDYINAVQEKSGEENQPNA